MFFDGSTMHLLIADYQDIGPFEGGRTVVFQQHATLIQAPVGSGKSFLFFDGIVYGLYKYSTRPLLRHHAQSGEITVAFVQQGQTYLIRRTLTHGKTKDRAQSTLYRLGEGFDALIEETYGSTVLHQNRPLRPALQSSTIVVEEIPTKTDTELQQLVDAMIPPRSVLTHTQLLLQDSDNIFTMSAADRITVFQHLFALLDIDSAKAMIADAKKENQTRIRVLSDTSRMESKYCDLIKNIQKTVGHSGLDQGSLGLVEDSASPCSRDLVASAEGQFALLFEQRLAPIESIDDLAIEQTTLPHGRVDAITTDITTVTTQLETLHTQHAQRQQQSQALEQSRKQLTTLQSQSQTYDRQIHTLQQEIAKTDQSALTQAETSKTTLQNTYNTQLTQIDRSGITTQLQPRVGQIEGFSLDALADQHPRGLQTIISQLIAHGRELRLADENRKLLAQKEAEQQSKDITQCEKLIQTTITSRDDRQRQLTTLVDQIQQFQTQQKQSHQVACPHCGGDISSLCAHTDQHQSVIDTLTTQKTSLQSELTSLETSLTEHQKHLAKLQQPSPISSEASSDLLTTLASTMKAISRQSLQSQIEQITTTEKSLTQATKTYESLRHQADQIQAKTIELTKFQTQKESLATQIATLQKTISDQQNSLGPKPDPSVLQTTKSKLSNLQQIQTSMERLTELHDDLHQQILQRKDLELRDTKLKNLHHILSKEIMYVVLETALPSLFTIINALLAQVVDYQLHFTLAKNSSDRLELEVEIEDAKGRRSISSLSGGQKVILKLARILAVASYMRLPLLLLDETINNLDADLISRVAELIDDVIRKQDMTLYVVTHSPHIQQMNVWEEVVEVR